MKNHVTFACGKNEGKLTIQLEPEALVFEVLPVNEISFEGSNAENIGWSMSFDRTENFIQLCPTGVFDITIYENGVLLDNWWKYM